VLGDVEIARIEHYLQVLVTSYAGRLRKAFAPEDFDQMFRLDEQLGLFDRPIAMQPLVITCASALAAGR
jgi:DNA polymerase I